MTDEELDSALIKFLKAIREEYKDYAAYLKEPLSKEYQEIKEDYQYVIDDITDILKQVKSLDDLAEMDEETISAVYDYLDEYASNYVIAAENPQKQKDLDEYAKVEEILNLFLDDDSEEEI